MQSEHPQQVGANPSSIQMRTEPRCTEPAASGDSEDALRAVVQTLQDEVRQLQQDVVLLRDVKVLMSNGDGDEEFEMESDTTATHGPSRCSITLALFAGALVATVLLVTLRMPKNVIRGGDDDGKLAASRIASATSAPSDNVLLGGVEFDAMKKNLDTVKANKRIEKSTEIHAPSASPTALPPTSMPSSMPTRRPTALPTSTPSSTLTPEDAFSYMTHTGNANANDDNGDWRTKICVPGWTQRCASWLVGYDPSVEKNTTHNPETEKPQSEKLCQNVKQLVTGGTWSDVAEPCPGQTDGADLVTCAISHTQTCGRGSKVECIPTGRLAFFKPRHCRLPRCIDSVGVTLGHTRFVGDSIMGQFYKSWRHYVKQDKGPRKASCFKSLKETNRLFERAGHRTADIKGVSKFVFGEEGQYLSGLPSY